MSRRSVLLPALLVCAVTFWAASLVAAPYALSRHAPHGAQVVTSMLVYAAGDVVCHQRPERSFHPWGTQLPVCARCAGLYAGALAGLLGLVWPVSAGRTRALLIAAAVPTAATFLAELGGLVDPGNAVRAAAALPLGAATSWFVSGVVRGAIN